MKRCMYFAVLAGLLMIAVPQSALAEKPIYSYIEAGYNEIDVEDPSGASEDGDGVFGGISFGFFKNFHVFGRYNTDNTDTSDTDINTLMVGGGWHGLLGEKADLIGEVAWIDQEFDGSSFKADDSGYFVRVGARWRPIKLVEVGGWYRYQDVEVATAVDTDDAFEANAMVHLWRFSIGLGAELQGDIETYNAFARFNLGG